MQRQCLLRLATFVGRQQLYPETITVATGACLLQQVQKQHQCPVWTSSSCSGGAVQYCTDSIPQGSDEYYWVPGSHISPSSIAQQRATGRLESALESVLLGDAVLREQLVERFGLNIHRIQLAKDRRTVFVLWDAHPGQAAGCERALQKNAFRLRQDLAKLLQSKHTPRLEFRHDHLPPLKAAVAAAMEQVEQELAVAAAAAATGSNCAAAAAAAAGGSSSSSREPGADAGSAASLDPAMVEAAIARLEALTAPRLRTNESQQDDSTWGEQEEEWEENEEGEWEEEQEQRPQQLPHHQEDDGAEMLPGHPPQPITHHSQQER